uniref:DNA helicase n=1 Tax=Macrostomum lignano TaxID=282301 RepID=A0A1I8G875_9PLAT
MAALINWKHLPSLNSLNGVKMDELQLLSELSSTDHHDDQAWRDFIDWIENDHGTEELPDLPKVDGFNEQLISTMDSAELQSLSKSTVEQMNRHGEAFVQLLTENTPELPTTMEAWKLNEYLRYFYFGMKKQDVLNSQGLVSSILGNCRFENCTFNFGASK